MSWVSVTTVTRGAVSSGNPSTGGDLAFTGLEPLDHRHVVASPDTSRTTRIWKVLPRRTTSACGRTASVLQAALTG